MLTVLTNQKKNKDTYINPSLKPHSSQSHFISKKSRNQKHKSRIEKRRSKEENLPVWVLHQHSASIFLPLFLCIFLSWVSSTSPPSPSPSPTTAAAEILRNKGYSLFAATINALTSDTTEQFNRWNGTGTLFVAPDFAFSYSTVKFKNSRVPSRPNSFLLSYHALRQILPWKDLSIQSEGESFLTFSPRRCIFICKNPAGEFCIVGIKNPIGDYLRIRNPDLFISENLIIHGVDGVLDPSSASICTDSNPPSSTAAIDYSYLDHAIRTLKQRGYGIVATALAMQRSDLMNITGITVFAPRDENLFGLASGFRYDLRYHVVPRRINFSDLAILPYGDQIQTLVHREPIVVGSINGTVTVNGVKIDDIEIYQNDRVVLLDVPRPLHISVGSSSQCIGSPVMSHDSGLVSERSSDSGEHRSFVVSPSASPNQMTEAPSTFSEFDEEDLRGDSTQSPSPSTLMSVSGDDRRCAPAVSPRELNGALSFVFDESYCPITPQNSRNVDVASSPS